MENSIIVSTIVYLSFWKTLSDQISTHVISDYIVLSSTSYIFTQKIHNISDQVSTTIRYVLDGVVVEYWKYTVQMI